MGDGGEGGEAEENYEKDGEHVLDLPPAWVDPLFIRRSDVARGLGLGEGGNRTTLHYRAKVERFAPYAHRKGLVLRSTRFSDDARLCPAETVEVFQHRNDKLRLRRVDPVQCSWEEWFEPNRPRNDGVRCIREVLGVRREVEFYTAARLDGLQRRVELFGKKIMEFYDPEVTPNRLTYRSVTFAESAAEDKGDRVGESRRVQEAHPASGLLGVPGTAPSDLIANSIGRTMEATGNTYVIRKMAEKYARNPARPAYEDIAKVKYLVRESEIEVRYHISEGRIVGSARRYVTSEEGGGMEMITADPFAPELERHRVEADFREAVTAQRACYDDLRDKHRRCTIKLLDERAREEAGLELERDAFEIAAQRAAGGGPLHRASAEAAEEGEGTVDYLAPFLIGVKDSMNMTYEEAMDVHLRCERALKQRHMERMNIIQRRIEAEEEQLQRRQREVSRARGEGGEPDAEFEQACAELLYRINILHQRLKRQDERFKDQLFQLADTMRRDPRFAILYQRNQDSGGAGGGSATRVRAGRRGSRQSQGRG